MEKNKVAVNFRIRHYTNQVLGVIKEKYALRDKAEALDKFTEIYGIEFVEPEVKEEFIKEVIESCNRHIKRYGYRSMSKKEFKEVFELS
ncbi:MAG: hypothetical protein QT11_C0001G1046 [archaeon GW2011_AR20]|nr:MAG: hypothetical protein QT11_C0001G1046 [archaeon GW2011_AR20]AQS33397.1 hypothetical protein [uncultured archaeon]MBS3160984.1 DUF2683 family protein [Candidatus Woesearchaeota archaeon]AQS33540.1 hypothetical protein [uncultured archaeon]AQS34542.1 hypothetical protein [uncultured archaeon]